LRRGRKGEGGKKLAVLVLLWRLHADGAFVVSDLSLLLLGLHALHGEVETLLLDLANEVATDVVLSALTLALESLLRLLLLRESLLGCTEERETRQYPLDERRKRIWTHCRRRGRGGSRFGEDEGEERGRESSC
jgi:hypothetical protein